MKNIYYRIVGYNQWRSSYSEAVYYANKSKPYTIETKTLDEMTIQDILSIGYGD